MKLFSWLVIFFLSIQLVFAASLDLILDLDSDKYGPQQAFDGSIVLDYRGNLSFDEIIEARVRNGGSVFYNTTLGNLVDSSYETNEERYEVKGLKSSFIFQGKSDYYFGISLEDEVDRAVFYVRGMELSGVYPDRVILDVGNDKDVEWQYSGAFRGWSSYFYPEGIFGNESSIGEIRLKAGSYNEKCNDIPLTFNELFNQSKIEVSVRAKKTAEGGNLSAIIRGPGISSAECDLPEPGGSFTAVSCSIDSNQPESGDYEFCIFSSSGDASIEYYRLEKADVPYFNYYFIKARIAEYETKLNKQVPVGGDFLVNALNDYYDDECDGRCVVPVRIHAEGGKLEVSNLDLSDIDGLVITSFSELDFKPAELVVRGEASLPLSEFPNLKTPRSKDEYRLRINFMGESDEKLFEVVDAPVAIIKLDRESFAKGESIVFDGSSSYSPNGEIFRFEWDFGDNTTARGMTASHTYTTVGEYKVKLTVEDETGVRGSVSKSIYVGNLEERLSDIFNNTIARVDSAKNFFSNASNLIKGISDSLGYSALLDSAKSNLTSLQLEYNSVKNSGGSQSSKDSSYIRILRDVEEIKSKTPYELTIVEHFTFDNLILEKEDIPSPDLVQLYPADKNLYLIEVYNFNLDYVIIDLDAKDFLVEFLSGESKESVLVRKDVSIDSGGDYIFVEDLRDVILYSDDVVVLTPGGEISNRIIRWNIGGSKSVSYLLADKSVEDTKKAVSVVFTKVSEPVSSGLKIECGNKLCEYSEEYGIDESDPLDEEYYCPEDCKKQIPWSIVIALVVIFILGMVYIYIYRGPGSLKRKAPETKTNLNEMDMIRLRVYIRDSLLRGFSKQEIVQALTEKGWDKQHIDEGFKGLG